MIEQVEYDVVYNVWINNLWPDRKSPIEKHSAMLMGDQYDLKNYEYEPTFFIVKDNGTIVGCNSGHKCCDDTYRSRGLYVFPDYRKKGYGKKLLLATINQGRKENSDAVWSYPRYESWSTYKSAGFELISEWREGETGTNAYCKLVF